MKEFARVLTSVKGGDFSNRIGLVKEKEADFIISSINSLISFLEEMQKLREAEVQDFQIKTSELEKTKKALINILEDIEVAREKAEEEKNKTISIITNFSDGLMVFDQEKKLSLINPLAENFFGVKARDLIGKSLLELSQYPNFLTLVSLLGEEIKGIFRKEISLREDLILEVDAIPIAGKEQVESLVILHDITREKMIERIKTEFVSISAHQLRTPLAAIKWTLRMILDGDVGSVSQEQREYLEKTYISNERMINLINDLLDVTRIEEGRYLYKPVPTDLDLVVQFVISACKEDILRKNLKVEFQKPEKKLPRLMLDVEKIKLAVQNFMENAIKYTPSDGQITVALKPLEKEVEFSIKDTGAGIPQDQQGRVFTKFFRGSNVVRIDTEGTGLGLFITKNIIEAHGGKVWFESEEGKGTTFYFTLPVKESFGEFIKEF
ncbi:MAG: ATP-binding protein [Patescibacteria group bacterium]